MKTRLQNIRPLILPGVALLSWIALGASLIFIEFGIGLLFWAATTSFLVVLYFRCLHPLRLIQNGLDALIQGNERYRIGLDSRNMFYPISTGIDQLAHHLSELKQRIITLESQQEDTRSISKNSSIIREQFHRLFENPNFAVFMCDFFGSILDLNETACSMLGYSRDQLQKIPFYQLYTPDELTRSITASRIGADQRALRYESRFQTASGKEIDVEISANVFDYQSEMIQYLVMDISHRKAVEQRLKESEERFRSFTESAHDLIFITNEKGRIVYANPAMVRTLGYDATVLSTFSIWELDAESLSEQHDRITDYLHEPPRSIELSWRTVDGRKIEGELTVAGIFDDDGECRGLRGIFRNLSERKKIQKAQRLGQLGRLTADIAHEVKNRLGAIMSIADYLILDETSHPQIGNDLRMIKDQCNMMDSFVRQMLNFSRPSREEVTKVQVQEVLDSVMSLMSKTFKRHRIRVIRHYEKSIPPLMLNERQMSEVFMNLLQNAQEAMPDGGTIHLRIRQGDSQVEIDIQDNGEGISEENLASIFDPFFTTKESGTGLGVSACYGIIKAHQGNLAYTSVKGEGTTAHITLPFSLTEHQEDP